MSAGAPSLDRERGVGNLSLALLVGLAGAATMVIELGAVRLLAPWFGTSSSVWTNVIGVVLAALALGYAIGARLASGAAPQRTLGIVLLLGAAFAAWLPFGAAAVASWFMPEGVALHDAADLLVWGSLGAASLLFLPAAATLGCAGPLAVEVLQRTRGGSAGRAGGHVLSASTIGSLIGTFGTTHLFIPTLGVTGTFLTAAGTLAVAGALLMATGRRGSAVLPAVVLLVGVAGGVLSAGGAQGRPPAEGETLLASMDSSLQSLRVVETGEGAERTRFLRVNESLDSFQSVWKPATGLLQGGHYYDYFALPYAWAHRERGAAPEEWNVLVVGLGAGTAVRVLEGVVEDGTRLRTVGVEIDAAVVDLGKRFFDLQSDDADRVAVGGMDGRAALAYTDRQFDQIIVDAYANNMEIPPHLASVEAFRAMRGVLAEGGWISINVGGFGLDDPVVRAVAAAATVGLGEPVSIGRVPFSRNLCVTLRKGAAVPAPGTSEFGSRGPSLVGGTARLIAGFTIPNAWRVLDAGELGGEAMTDDRSNMEALQLQSITEAATRLALLDDASRDGSLESSAAGGPTSEDQSNAEAARRLAREGSDLALAFEAIAAIESPPLRLATESHLLWGAGDLFRALEVAGEGLAYAPRDTGLLLSATNLGLIVGASDAASVRLGRLQEVLAADQAMGDEARTWWEGQTEPLLTFEADAAEVAGRKAAAIRDSRRAAWLMGACALGLILMLGLAKSPGSDTSRSSATG